MANLDTLHPLADSFAPVRQVVRSRGKGHPMKEWVQVADADEQPPAILAEQAYDTVVVGNGG